MTKIMSDRKKFEIAMRGVNRIDDFIENVQFWNPRITVDQVRERIQSFLDDMTDEFKKEAE